MTNLPHKALRTPLNVTLTVWKALFLREMVTRLSSRRGASIWMLVDPMLQMSVILVIFTVLRVKVVSGIDAVAWLIIGLTFYGVFKSSATRADGAVGANRSLFAFRQVRPVDAVVSRAFLEGFLDVLVILTFAGGAIFLFDVDLIPDDLGLILLAFLGLWLMGLGFALVTSVLVELLPELKKIVNLISTPLYMTSGAIVPVNTIVEPYRSWILYNPILHGIEVARSGVSAYYHTPLGTDIIYLYQCALVAIFLGLALHIRFQTKLLTE